MELVLTHLGPTYYDPATNTYYDNRLESSVAIRRDQRFGRLLTVTPEFLRNFQFQPALFKYTTTGFEITTHDHRLVYSSSRERGAFWKSSLLYLPDLNHPGTRLNLPMTREPDEIMNPNNINIPGVHLGISGQRLFYSHYTRYYDALTGERVDLPGGFVALYTFNRRVFEYLVTIFETNHGRMISLMNHNTQEVVHLSRDPRILDTDIVTHIQYVRSINFEVFIPNITYEIIPNDVSVMLEDFIFNAGEHLIGNPPTIAQVIREMREYFYPNDVEEPPARASGIPLLEKSYETLLRRLYGLPVELPASLNGLELVPFSELSNLNILRYELNLLLQPYASPGNNIITLITPDRTVLVHSRFDPNTKRISPP